MRDKTYLWASMVTLSYLDLSVAQTVEYGVREEQGVYRAFIQFSDGTELVSVAFDLKTEIEDLETQRFFGFTIEEMEALENQGDPELLIHPLTLEAAFLWQGDFPEFNGTPGQREILRRQSEYLVVMLDMTGAGHHNVHDACTAVPDIDKCVHDCCNAHDNCYAYRRPPRPTRKQCDKALRACIIGCDHDIVARIYYAGVRMFGNSFFNIPPQCVYQVVWISRMTDLCGNLCTDCPYALADIVCQRECESVEDCPKRLIIITPCTKSVCKVRLELLACVDCPPNGKQCGS